MVRRAEVIQSHGEWSQALQEIQDACMRLTSPQGNPAAGEAYYRQAELHRLVGRFEEAEDCYREAARRGRKPQPGLALLRLAQCQYDAAEIAIRNTLLETKDIKSRAELLPGTVHIMIAVNQKEEALEAARELSHIAKRLNAPYLYAISAHCQGTVFLAEGKAKPALDQSQSALKVWSTLHLPYEAAHTRLLKALVYRELNDKDNSDAELVAAKWIFEQLNAMPDLARTNQLLNDKQNHKAYGLTLRELQVLRLVASGKTNKSVAGELFISERTVDRHVSNIFNKLDVSSRVEATAFAIKNRLLEKDL